MIVSLAPELLSGYLLALVRAAAWVFVCPPFGTKSVPTPTLRKLLLHKDEIRKLTGKTVERGMTLVPIRLYFKNGRVKVALSLAKGKKEYDKRETIKRRETDRETRAAVKSRR